MESTSDIKTSDNFDNLKKINELLAVLPSSLRTGRHRLFEYFTLKLSGALEAVIQQRLDTLSQLPATSVKEQAQVQALKTKVTTTYAEIETRLGILGGEEAEFVKIVRYAAQATINLSPVYAKNNSRDGVEFRAGVKEAFQEAESAYGSPIGVFAKSQALNFLEAVHPWGRKAKNIHQDELAIILPVKTRSPKTTKLSTTPAAKEPRTPKPIGKGREILLKLPFFAKRGSKKKLLLNSIASDYFQAGQQRITLVEDNTPSRILKLSASWASLMENRKAKVSAQAEALLSEAAKNTGLQDITPEESFAAAKFLQMFWFQGKTLAKAYKLPALPEDITIGLPRKIKHPDFRKPVHKEVNTHSAPVEAKSWQRLKPIKAEAPAPQVTKETKEEIDETSYPAGVISSLGLGKKHGEIFFKLSPYSDTLPKEIDIKLTKKRDRVVFKNLLINMKSETPAADKTFELKEDGTVLFFKKGKPLGIKLGQLKREDLTIGKLLEKSENIAKGEKSQEIQEARKNGSWQPRSEKPCNSAGPARSPKGNIFSSNISQIAASKRSLPSAMRAY